MITGKSIGPWAAAGAVTVLAIGTALTVGGDSGPSPSTALSETRLDQVERDLTESYVDSAGTRQDRTAQRLAAHTTFQQAIVSCMRATGQDYTPVPAPVPRPDMPSERGMSNTAVIEMVSDASLGVHEEFEYALVHESSLVGEPVNAAYLEVPEADRDRYLASIDQCTPDGSSADAAAALPAVAQQMFDELHQLVLDAADDPQVQELMAQYPTCMDGHGYDVVDLEHLRTTFQNRYSDLQQHGVGPTSGPWEQAAADEAAAARADQDCREQAHDMTLSLVAEPLAEFRERHASAAVTARAEITAASERTVHEYTALIND